MDSAQDTKNTSDTNNLTQLETLLTSSTLPADLRQSLTDDLQGLKRMLSSGSFQPEVDRQLKYLQFVATLPFAKSSQDILDLGRATQILDKNHYGLQPVKDRILEYLSVLILNAKAGQPLKSSVLAFVGLVGSGKTSLAYSIAESLGRQIIRIPLGGLGSVAELKGGSRIKNEAEPGRLMKQIHELQVCNPVVLLDEIDRVASENRSDVMGVLVELLDPEQNNNFLDYFVDYPFDLSKALFIVTANNTTNIATAVLDRLEIIEMPSYSDEEKIVIGKSFILPKVVQEAGLSSGVIIINEDVWPQIVRPLGYDGGIRSLQRTIEKIIRKVARSFVEGKAGPYHLGADNIGMYIN